MKSIVIVLAFTASIANAQYSKENLKMESSTSQAKYRYENLQLYPIHANAAFVSSNRSVGKYETLKNALEKKKVTVTESKNEEVNNLFIENVSKDTVMILAGEVVQGGKQDRMVAQDVILYPKKR
jgi:hypothetical protein